jgi:glyoxylase-like metal-dependent hydrolase (beta-lactamase superfamily II)
MEIVENIHQVDGVNANVYIIIEKEGLTLIDTGMPNNAKKILNYVKGIDRKPADTSTILITHAHIDHVGSAQELKKITNAKIAVHQEDADVVAGNKKPPRLKGATGVMIRVLSPFFKFARVQPDIILEENDHIGRLQVLHTPGHTPGSISLYDSTRKVMFVGDTIRFANGQIDGPPKRFTPDMASARKSIQRISQMDFDIMLSGHGEPLRPNASTRVKEFYAALE